jgi:hypothetical protein
MGDFSKALASLADPANEPLNWLLGDFIRGQAHAHSPHFLLDLLERPLPDVLGRWNWWVSEFRRLVTNYDILPQKVRDDLIAGKGDVRIKVKGVIAEIFAVLHLSEQGYGNFKAVLPAGRSNPDFLAEFEGKPARIEVKNLAEPEDWISHAALARWKERSKEDPEKYKFRAVLKHNSRGSASDAAIKRLRTMVDQLPGLRSPFEEDLEGGIRVRFEKHEIDAEPKDLFEKKLYGRYRAKPRPSGYMSVITGIGPRNLEFNVGDFQSVFLKALRVIAEATPKFFSKNVDRAPHNVIALRWEVPDAIVDPEIPGIIAKEIETLFSNFSLQLKVFMFWHEPKVPLKVLKGEWKGMLNPQGN